MNNLSGFNFGTCVSLSGARSVIVTLNYNLFQIQITVVVFEFGIERIPNCLCRPLAFWHTL